MKTVVEGAQTLSLFDFVRLLTRASVMWIRVDSQGLLSGGKQKRECSTGQMSNSVIKAGALIVGRSRSKYDSP